MATVYMVRHGRAATDGGLDPGLDDLGRQQARATAAALSPLGPLPILSSPFARARQTAEPLAALWERKAVIEPRVAEIPFPTRGPGPNAPCGWPRPWREAGSNSVTTSCPGAPPWWDCVQTQPRDCVIFCHYIAINVALGGALGDDRVVIFPPDNGSVTILDNAGGSLTLIELGREAQTHVN